MLTEPKKLLKLKDVMLQTGLSRAGLYKYIQCDYFPRQIPIGGRSVRWDEQEVQAWILARIEERDRLIQAKIH